jgi:hypothetical protein
MFKPVLHSRIEQGRHGASFGIRSRSSVAFVRVANGAAEPKVGFVVRTALSAGSEMFNLQWCKNQVLRAQTVATAMSRCGANTPFNGNGDINTNHANLTWSEFPDPLRSSKLLLCATGPVGRHSLGHPAAAGHRRLVIHPGYQSKARLALALLPDSSDCRRVRGFDRPTAIPIQRRPNVLDRANRPKRPPSACDFGRPQPVPFALSRKGAQALQFRSWQISLANRAEVFYTIFWQNRTVCASEVQHDFSS